MNTNTPDICSKELKYPNPESTGARFQSIAADTRLGLTNLICKEVGWEGLELLPADLLDTVSKRPEVDFEKAYIPEVLGGQEILIDPNLGFFFFEYDFLEEKNRQVMNIWHSLDYFQQFDFLLADGGSVVEYFVFDPNSRANGYAVYRKGTQTGEKFETIASKPNELMKDIIFFERLDSHIDVDWDEIFFYDMDTVFEVRLEDLQA